jgi:lysine biosynthesis protein LysW
MTKAECPSCGAKVNVGVSPRMGQHFTCSKCGTLLEIVGLDPVELDWPFDDDDDDDYDEEDD